MTKFKVEYEVTRKIKTSIYTTIEADNVDAARERATRMAEEFQEYEYEDEEQLSDEATAELVRITEK